MDPNELENIVNNLNEDIDSEEDQAEEEMEDDEEDIEEAEQDVDEVEEEEEDKMVENDETEEEEVPVSSKQQSTSKKFRDLYMTKVTQAFGSDLDQIRQVKKIWICSMNFLFKTVFLQEPNLNGPRLNILIDSLEAGIDIFSNLEQEIIIADEEQ